MAGVYIVTGKLGNGKTLVTVGRIREALREKKRVVTNLDLNLKAMFGRYAKDINVIRIPDKPTIADLEVIGKGYDGPYNENNFGLLVLDECGTWFNSRNWQDKTRKPVNDWFLHARKLRWEVYLIVQDINILDSQARDSIAEFLVYCRRLDNIRLPLVGGFIKMLTGIRLTLPRLHRAKVVYSDDSILSDVWNYRGNDLFDCYQTDQLFMADYPHGPHCVLPPWHTHGRYSVPLNWSNLMRLTKIYWKRFKSPVALTAGLLFGAFAGFMKWAEPPQASTLQTLPQVTTDTAERTNAVIDKLKPLVISGNMNINGEYRYQFSHPEKDTGTVYTSTELERIGVTFHEYGECRVDAEFAGSRVPILCL